MVAAEANRVVGLTGGIASGKSTVARLLRERGVGVVDADEIAREVVGLGSAGLREIVHAFGAEVLDGEGKVDRAQLAARVFADEALRRKLEAITHPKIARTSAERIAALLDAGAPYVVYDAALLFEVGAHRGLAATILVAADEETQIARAVARGGSSADEVRRRIGAQWPVQRKRALADYVIENTGSLGELAARVEQVHRELLALFGAQTKEA